MNHRHDRKNITDTEIEQLGYEDAIEAIRDSGSTQSPHDGWDSWLISGIGCKKTIELFGESLSANENGWCDAMRRKLDVYSKGAERACDEARRIQRQ